jgi:hypothetical protein
MQQIMLYYAVFVQANQVCSSEYRSLYRLYYII